MEESKPLTEAEKKAQAPFTEEEVIPDTCPVAPMLRALGIHKAKPPADHA